MAEQKVELRKIRDLGENLNDTFSFIRQNLKPLVTSFLGIAGVFMLANAILGGLYEGQVGGGIFKDILAGTRRNVRNPLFMFNTTYFILIILGWLNIVAMNVVIACYVKLYGGSGGEAPTIEKVWAEFKKYFFKVLVFKIPITVLIIIGCCLCLFPGIWLIVVFTPFSIVLIVEDKSFSDAWSRCFAIIKNNFWNSLGIYILVYLIYSLSAGIISSIVGLITGLVSYFTTKDISSTIGIVTSVLQIFSFVFYIVFYVSVCMHYFNLTERHDGTGMMQRLDTLGGGGNDFNNVQEQY